VFFLVSLLMASASAPKSVEITVYNQNFGLVKEVRTVSLRAGVQELRLEDVAAFIDPTTVGFRALTPGIQLNVLEQNYQYDLLTTGSLLSKSIGKRVRFRQVLESGQVITTEGILLAAPGQIVNPPSTRGGYYGDYYPSPTAREVATGIIIRTDDGRIVLNPQGTIEVMEIPEGLISKPTLMWLLSSPRAGTFDIEVAYLTDNITWNADYVLTLNQDDTRADLNGWVTINNQSGATYENASLKLVAGDVRRIRPRPLPGVAPGFGAAPEAARAERGFVEEPFFEYHLYTLQRPATVRDRETKQISLITASNVGVQKELVFEPLRSLWRQYGRNYRPGEGLSTFKGIKTNVVVIIENSSANNLGIPLPKGVIHVYKRDSGGKVQMVGEDQIEHTPKEEKIRLWIGDAFDVLGDWRAVNLRRGSSWVEWDIEIRLRNRKETPVTVRAVEHAWGDWVIQKESQPSTKLDANTFEYVVTLNPNEEKVITYTVLMRW
jgi:hypothetical protein